MSSGSFRARLRHLLRETRARLRHLLGLALRGLLGGGRRHDTPLNIYDNTANNTGDSPGNDGGIRSVLVVRINGRLGNTLFLTPLLRQLHIQLPQARIDVAVAYPNAAALLAGMPGLDRVIVFPHKGGAGMVARYFDALRSLRARRYDLLVDPDPFSTSSRIVQCLGHARWRLGFDSPMQWAPLTHAVPMPEPALHMGQAPVYLLMRGLNLPWQSQDARLWLPLSAAETAAGREAVATALTRVEAPADSPVLGFFAHATGRKDLGADWWRDFWVAFLQLAPRAQPVEFLPSPTARPINPAGASLNLPAQRLLTAAISTTHLFICADGGPMHLAGCTDTPVIGLFNGHTDPALYGPLKPADRSIDVRGRTPEQVARQVFEVWQTIGPGL